MFAKLGPNLVEIAQIMWGLGRSCPNVGRTSTPMDIGPTFEPSLGNAHRPRSAPGIGRSWLEFRRIWTPSSANFGKCSAQIGASGQIRPNWGAKVAQHLPHSATLGPNFVSSLAQQWLSVRRAESARLGSDRNLADFDQVRPDVGQVQASWHALDR